MKKRVSVLNLAVMFPVVLVLIICYFFQKENQELRKNQVILEQQDVLRLAKINELENALAEKLVSHCDTMTIAEKIKATKLRDYDLKVWQENEQKKTESFNSKQKADMVAFQNKQDESMKAFNAYRQVTFFNLTELSKSNPKDFATYVVMTFWEEHSIYSNPEIDHEVWLKNEKIKQLPAIKSFIDFDSAAYAKYQEADKIAQKKYEIILKENEQRYKVQQADLDVEYQNLIEDKKFELGL